VTTQHSSGGEWHTQLGTWLGAVALALALYALLRDNPNTRSSDDSLAKQTAQVQLRDTIIQLQNSLNRNAASPGERPSAAESWLYFQSVQDMLDHEQVTPSLAGCLVLANFAFSHADVSQGNHFLTLASSQIKKETSPVTQCLARAAMAHFMFDHAPTTPIAEGRERYAEAVAESNKLTGQGAPFVQLNILQEWALDEFSAGHEDAGDAQHAAAIKLLENESFSPAYRTAWEQDMDTAIIKAKVRGKLL
jgi:hypothetical protein